MSAPARDVPSTLRPCPTPRRPSRASALTADDHRRQHVLRTNTTGPSELDRPPPKNLTTPLAKQGWPTRRPIQASPGPTNSAWPLRRDGPGTKVSTTPPYLGPTNPLPILNLYNRTPAFNGPPEIAPAREILSSAFSRPEGDRSSVPGFQRRTFRAGFLGAGLPTQPCLAELYTSAPKQRLGFTARKALSAIVDTTARTGSAG